MWYLVLAPLVVIAWLAFVVYKVFTADTSWDVEAWGCTGGVLGTICLAGVLAIFGTLAIRSTTGLCEGYSKGQVAGYIVEVGEEGIVWKTEEVMLSVRADELVAYQKPVKLSLPDPRMARELRQNIGAKVLLSYKGWLMMPYWLGESAFEVTAIEWLD